MSWFKLLVRVGVQAASEPWQCTKVKLNVEVMLRCVRARRVWCWRDSALHCWTGCDFEELSVVLIGSFTSNFVPVTPLGDARAADASAPHVPSRSFSTRGRPGQRWIRAVHERVFILDERARIISGATSWCAPASASLWTGSRRLQVIPHRGSSSSSSSCSLLDLYLTKPDHSSFPSYADF